MYKHSNLGRGVLLERFHKFSNMYMYTVKKTFLTDVHNLSM